jgi:short-subunit dehydrogenase
MDNYFSQKTAIITGGSKGIGRETARLLGRHGCRVVISGRDETALQRTASEFLTEGIEVLAVAGDVTIRKDCQALVDQSLTRFGDIDILVNNAGRSMRGFFAETTLDLFQKVMDINFTGAVTMTKLALPYITKAKGSIIFISSVAGLKGLPAGAPYSASKMALKSFSESLRSELIGVAHVGILYAGFTENDPDKQKFNGNGELIPARRERFASTQVEVAQAAVQMLLRRKRQTVMTLTGKLASFAYTVFPALSERLIIMYSRKTSMFGKEDVFKG